MTEEGLWSNVLKPKAGREIADLLKKIEFALGSEKKLPFIKSLYSLLSSDFSWKHLHAKFRRTVFKKTNQLIFDCSTHPRMQKLDIQFLHDFRKASGCPRLCTYKLQNQSLCLKRALSNRFQTSNEASEIRALCTRHFYLREGMRYCLSTFLKHRLKNFKHLIEIILEFVV